MLTKYFTQTVVKFNPSAKGSKLARIFLASIPPSSRGSIKVSQTVIPSGSNIKQEISVTYKDGHVITIDPATTPSTVDMTETFDRYSRKLKIKQDISDS